LLLNGTLISTAPVDFSIGVAEFFLDLHEGAMLAIAIKIAPERSQLFKFSFMIVCFLFYGKCKVVCSKTKVVPESVINYQLRITNYELRLINYELRCINYELRITTSQLRITWYQLRITNYVVPIASYGFWFVLGIKKPRIDRGFFILYFEFTSRYPCGKLNLLPY
jgi:hypothetical protein